MSFRSRTVLLAALAAIALLVVFSAEAWVGVPIVAAVAVSILAREHRLSRESTAAALGVIAALAFVAFGTIIVLLAGLARGMAGIVLASGTTTIILGLVILALSIRHLRRVTSR